VGLFFFWRYRKLARDSISDTDIKLFLSRPILIAVNVGRYSTRAYVLRNSISPGLFNIPEINKKIRTGDMLFGSRPRDICGITIVGRGLGLTVRFVLGWVRVCVTPGGVGTEDSGIQGGHYRSNTGRVVRTEYAWGMREKYTSLCDSGRQTKTKKRDN
jgi:hypothetical protein